MNHRFLASLFAIIIACLVPVQSSAKYDPAWNWKTVDSEHFTLYYPEGYEPFAERVLSLEKEVYGNVSGYLDVTPSKCPIVLNPGTDLFNGFYSPFPNRISLYETPYFSLRGFGPGSDSMDMLFTHEYTHFAHITTKLGWYEKLSPYLGSDSAITNILSPGWLTEGITTNTETMFTDGGRGRCSYFKGQMMSFTEGEGLWNLSAAGTPPLYQPPGERIYLSGYFMVDYLNRVYGKDAFARLSRYQAAHPFGFSGEALQSVTHKDSSTFYKEFIGDLNKQADDMKNQAKSIQLPGGNAIYAEKTESIIDHFWTSKNTIIALRSGYDKKNALLEINPFSGRIIREIPTGRLNMLNRMRNMRDDTHIVFAGYYPKVLGEGELIDTDITLFDITSRRFHRLTKGAHVFSADLSSDKTQFVAVKRESMWTSLVLMDTGGRNPLTLFAKPGYQFESPSFAPDDSRIVCVVKTGQNSDIALVNPASGEITNLFESDIFEDNDPSFSPDGTWVLFSSNRSGIWNIFAWDLVQKKLYQLTSVNYGATCPRLSPDGKTLSFLNLYRGVNQLCTMPFDPVHGVKLYVKPGGEPEKPNLERVAPHIQLNPKTMDYTHVYTPYLHIPFFMSDPDDSKFGIAMFGGDPVNLNSYTAFLNYGLNSNQAGFDVMIKNRSFTPDLIAEVYDKAKKVTILDTAGTISREDWISEKLLSLATGFNMIHQVIPDETISHLNLGTHFKWRKFLDRSDLYSEKKAVSFFGDWTISHHPDAPERDVVPTWGQDIVLMYERTLPDLGTEVDSRNTVVSVTQYLPSFIKHHGFALRGAVQKQSEMMEYSKDYSLPHGYSTTDSDGHLNSMYNLLLSLEYHFPIKYIDNGPGLSMLHFYSLKGLVFSDWGAGWNGTFKGNELASNAENVVGSSVRAETYLFSVIPINFGIEIGYKTRKKQSYGNTFIMIGF